MRDIKDLIGDPVDPAMPVEHAPADEDGGHPIIATIVGVVLLLLMSGQDIRGPLGGGLEGQEARLVYLVSYAATATVMVWGIAFAITIRKASTGWKIGSLIAIAIASILMTVIKMSSPSTAFLEDATDVGNQMKEVATRANGAGDFKFKAGKGPMSRMTAAMLNPLIADSAAYQREMQSAGYPQIANLDGLTKRSPVLDHCETLDRLADRAIFYRSRWPDYVAAAVAVGREAVRSGEMPADALRGFEDGARENGGKIERQWELNRLSATEAAAICQIMARRRWEKPGNQLLFRNNADLAEFNRHVAKSAVYSTESEQIRASSKAEILEWTGEGKAP